ncbi:hypothetical protein PWT90_00226 [Aphanocladium album]|nr:hypothetical protein PWT90_00226 [Aphanocladium album]
MTAVVSSRTKQEVRIPTFVSIRRRCSAAVRGVKSPVPGGRDTAVRKQKPPTLRNEASNEQARQKPAKRQLQKPALYGSSLAENQGAAVPATRRLRAGPWSRLRANGLLIRWSLAGRAQRRALLALGLAAAPVGAGAGAGTPTGNCFQRSPAGAPFLSEAALCDRRPNPTTPEAAQSTNAGDFALTSSACLFCLLYHTLALAAVAGVFAFALYSLCEYITRTTPYRAPRPACSPSSRRAVSEGQLTAGSSKIVSPPFNTTDCHTHHHSPPLTTIHGPDSTRRNPNCTRLPRIAPPDGFLRRSVNRAPPQPLITNSPL